MLITSLLPLMTHYSLGFDLVAGPDETVTLTILPRKVAGATHNPQAAEARPISITANAAEIDAELERGADGALGQLIASRKTLADQIAQQREADEAAKTAAAQAAAVKSTAIKPSAPTTPIRAPALTSPPADATPAEPASLW